MGAPEHITDADVIEAVTALPGATAAEVAGALGIGRSTAAKRLVRLEAAGRVRRSAGGRTGGARVADRWFSAVPAGGAPEPEGGGEKHVGEEAVSEPTPSAAFDAGTDGQGDGGAPASEVSPRLGPGALAVMVREYLAARPDQSFGPSGVGKALGRSAGAVSNVLAAMAGRGEAVLVADKPRRYRIAR